MWWPELTVDVVQGDLQQLSKEGKKDRLATNLSTESVSSSMKDETEEYEWKIRPSQVEEKSKYSQFDSVLNRMKTIKKKIDRFRCNMSITAFHAVHVKASQGSNDWDKYVSPLNYCDSSTEQMDCPPPSAANTVEEYRQNLKAMGTTVCVPVTNLLLQHVREVQSTNEYFYQDVKDIQRDTISVNGEKLIGSEVGYDKIVIAIAKWIKSTVDVEEVAKTSLSVANRTFSGGIAFDNVMATFNADQLVLVVPISAEADPLDITIVDKADGPSILVRAHTKYRLETADTSEPLAVVNACMLAELCVEEMFESRAFVFLESTYS